MTPGAGGPAPDADQPEPSYFQVVTAVASRDEAAAIARALLEERAAACVQVVGPVESTYWWQGKIESSQEWLCIIKSTQETFPALEAAIRAQHPYDVPEILATPVSAGHSAYMDWLREEIRGQ